MKKKDWNRITRSELQEMLIAQVEENEVLKARLQEAEDNELTEIELLDVETSEVDPANVEPTELEQLKMALERARYKKRYNRMLRSTFFTLVVVAAVAVLVATLWMPVLRIYGTSMTPTLNEGDIVISLTGSNYETGDLLAFYLGNRLLIKRCIAGPGQWVDIDEEGNIYVDGNLLEEPYITEKAKGECDIQLPYQVPENMWFLVGDHRATSVDSRNTAVGCITEEQVVGKVIYRIWPFKALGLLE